MVDLPLMDWRALATLLVFCLAVAAAWLAGRVSVNGAEELLGGLPSARLRTEG